MSFSALVTVVTVALFFIESLRSGTGEAGAAEGGESPLSGFWIMNSGDGVGEALRDCEALPHLPGRFARNLDLARAKTVHSH